MAALLAYASGGKARQLVWPKSFRCSAAGVSAVIREFDVVMGDANTFLAVVCGVRQRAYD